MKFLVIPNLTEALGKYQRSARDNEARAAWKGFHRLDRKAASGKPTKFSLSDLEKERDKSLPYLTHVPRWGLKSAASGVRDAEFRGLAAAGKIRRLFPNLSQLPHKKFTKAQHRSNLDPWKVLKDIKPAKLP